ncbi:MAG: translation initiation factor IF-3, partial [Nocardioides sp.]
MSRLASAWSTSGSLLRFRHLRNSNGVFRPLDQHGGHISTELRINDRIRVPEVRLVGPNGETVGIVPTDQALKLAQEADLDLVEIAPQGKPPVCKLMDYGKFKYENAQKA